MARIEDEISKIADPVLRATIFDEVKKLKADKRFGLVFEEHLPELVPVYSAKVKAQHLVARRGRTLSETFKVVRLQEGMAEVEKNDGSRESISVEELTVVRRFGEPIYPALRSFDRVTNGDMSQPHHILIEADNYHALQMLEYCYPGKVDCIYIDPPFNSGSRDWKYNNDYVDSNDTWRHSKWLSMMRKRLTLAKRLLNPQNSTIIIAIDDNELFSLGLLVDQIFNDCPRQVVSVTINPKGKARDGRLSQVDEYLIVIYIGDAVASELSFNCSEKEVRWPYLRRSDVESARGTKKGGVRQFYPIYVDRKSRKIVAIGEALTPDQPLTDAPNHKGAIPVFPIRDDGKHMNWGLTGESLKKAVDLGFVRVSESTNPHQPYNFLYLTGPSIKKVEEGIYRVAGLRADGTKIVVIPGGKPQRGTTAWKKNLHDANAYGSQMVGTFLKVKKFPYPKSVYAVFDTLQLFLQNKPNALIVDFFAGSGTTLHALNLLNSIDNGTRQCILVTNNEVSEDEATKLTTQGYKPGDDGWNEHGICQSVTFPRSKYTILGYRDDGGELEEDYLTGRMVMKEKPRAFKQLGFTEGRLLTLAQRKQLVALIDKVPQSKITADMPFFLDDEIPVSILFDIRQGEAWLEALEDREHIVDFYLVTQDVRAFNSMKQQVQELLGAAQIEEEEKRPMKNGFSANLEYFKLDFLDPSEVQMGRQFAAILPILWMMAGARGPLPDAPDAHVPWLIPANCTFAVLIQERRFKEFHRHIESRDDLTHVFIVTNSASTYHHLREELKVPNVVQLYKDYLQNFKINYGKDAL